MKKRVKYLVFGVLAAVFAAALALYITGDPDDQTINSAVLLSAMMIVAAVAAIMLFTTIEKKSKSIPLRILINGALCVALAFVLSYVKLYTMPTGGSITLASMLPLCIFANRYGVKYGLMACVLYGVLQFIQNPYMLSLPQVLLEYPLAFGVIAFGGFFKKLPLTVVTGCFLRFLCHFFASIIFWREYLPVDYSTNMWIASLIYNGVYMGVDTLICAGIACVPQLNRALDIVLPKRNLVKKENA